MDKKKIGDFLKTRRIQLGLTPQEMALRVGCNRTTIIRWENGRRAILRTKVVPVAKAFEIAVSELATFCGYSPAEIPSNGSPQNCDSNISVTINDLKFLITIAEGLHSPMNLSMVRDLLQRRQEAKP